MEMSPQISEVDMFVYHTDFDMAPTKNITITVPDGTSQHGKPNLLCIPIKWYAVMLFYLVNYLAHAVTVKSIPGQKFGDTVTTIFAALIYPYSGIMRGIEAIARGSTPFKGDTLQQAARAGALCIVVRTVDWMPEDGQLVKGVTIHPEVNSIPPDDQSSVEMNATDRDEATPPDRTSLAWRTAVPEYLWEGLAGPLIPKNGRSIHGVHRLPPGYQFAVLPSNTRVEPNFEGEHEEISISFSYSLIKAAVSIIQVLFAAATLYRTRGDQLERYGYAAFGLTVLPYIVMSAVNLIGNLVTPEFSTLYMVRSSEMNEAEAESRGGDFDGVVGKVVEATNGNATYRFERSSDTWNFYSQDHANSSEDNSIQLGPVNTTVPSNVDHIEISSLPLACVENPAMIRDTSTIKQALPKNQVYHLEYQPNRHVKTHSPASVLLKKSSDPPGISVTVDSCTNFETVGRKRWGQITYGVTVVFSIYLFTAIPYAVIAALTRFDSGHSTKAQRVWTMGWLAFGTVWGIALPGFLVDMASMEESGDSDLKVFLQKFFIILFYGAFAIGGLVVVGQMLVAYGSCAILY